MVDLATWPTAAGGAGELLWEKMAKRWHSSGVIPATDTNQFEVFADSTGMFAKVKSGEVSINGFHAEHPAQTTLGIGVADATNDRIDRVVLRLDRSVSPYEIKLIVVAGSPAGTPVAPALLNSSTYLDIPLAKVLVTHGLATIAAGKITDERQYMRSATQPASKKLQGNLDLNGNQYVAHGITNLQTRVTNLFAAYKGNSGEAKPLYTDFVDGSNIFIGPALTGAFAEAAFKPYVLYITYADQSITW